MSIIEDVSEIAGLNWSHKAATHTECVLCDTYGPPNTDGFHITNGGRSARKCYKERG